MDVILQLIFDGFCLQKSMPEIIKFYWKNKYFLHSGCFNIISLLDVILVSTWIHVKLQNPPTSLLAGVQGASWVVLEVSWDVLWRPGNVLEHLKTVSIAFEKSRVGKYRFLTESVTS